MAFLQKKIYQRADTHTHICTHKEKREGEDIERKRGNINN